MAPRTTAMPTDALSCGSGRSCLEWVHALVDRGDGLREHLAGVSGAELSGLRPMPPTPCGPRRRALCRIPSTPYTLHHRKVCGCVGRLLGGRTHARTHTRTHMHTRTPTHAHAHTNAHAHTHTRTHTRTHTHTHTYTHTHTHTHIHTYTHIHTHTQPIQ